MQLLQPWKISMGTWQTLGPSASFRRQCKGKSCLQQSSKKDCRLKDLESILQYHKKPKYQWVWKAVLQHGQASATAAATTMAH